MRNIRKILFNKKKARNPAKAEKVVSMIYGSFFVTSLSEETAPDIWVR